MDSIWEPSAPSIQREKVLVEFSSPNLGQEFSGDHLRSTIIGAFIASLYESMGWNVFRINFLGDWGKHIGLLAVGWARFHSDDLFNEDPLRHLLNIYAKIEELFKSERGVVKEAPTAECLQTLSDPIHQDRDSFFKKMEDGELDAIALWNKFRESCVSTYTGLYARLGIKFDEYSGESKVSQETAVEVETILKDKGVVREEDGAWSIDFENNGYKGLGSPKIRYQNGTTTYLLRDIATALDRNRKHSFDKMIYVVTGKQDSHFHQITAGLELIGYSDLSSKLQHINFGRVHGLASDMGSSGLLLGDILDRCQKAVYMFLEMDHGDLYTMHGEEPLEIAKSLAGSALMTQGLSVKRGTTFNFDLDDMANFNQYNGLSLQSWLSKIGLKLKDIVIPYEAISSLDYSIFEQDEYEAFADVLRLLVQFPGTVKNSFRTLESSHILTLLFRVTDLLPDVWAADIDNQIQEVEEEEAYNAGPSNMIGSEPVNRTNTAIPKEELGEDVGESSLLKQPLQTGEWVEDDRLSKTETEGGHSEALEHSKFQPNSLKNDGNQQQPGQSHQEIDEKAEAQIDGPVEKLDVVTSLEARIHEESPLEEAPLSKGEHSPGSPIGDETSGINDTDKAGEVIGETTHDPEEAPGHEEPGTQTSPEDKERQEDYSSENEKHKISGTWDDDISQQGIILDSAEAEEYKQDKILGMQQQSLLQDPKDEGLKDGALTSCNIQTRQRKDSRILLGEEGFQQKAIIDEGCSENMAMNEVTGIEEQPTQEEAREQDDEISPERENEEQEQAGSEPASMPLNSKAGEELGKNAEKSPPKEEPPEEVENASQGDASENVLLGKTLTIREEDEGEGEGKERADQADDDLQISPERRVKLAFYECVRQVLENGMRMVGLVPLEV